MTSEMGDMFNAMREASREKRAQNRVASLQLLTFGRGLVFGTFVLKESHREKGAAFNRLWRD
jgi:hypothetical protein